LKVLQKTLPIKLREHKYLIILLAVSAISLQTEFFVGEESAWWISASVYFIVPGTLVVFSSLLAIKMAKSGHSIKLILLFTISVSMYFVAEQIWFIHELIGIDPFPSWADFFYLVAYPPMILFLFKLIKIPIRTIPKSNLLFVVLLTSSLFIPTYWSTYDSIAEQSLFDLVLALLYPILDIIVLFPILLGVLYSLKQRNYFLTYLMFGAFSTLLADTFYVYLFQKDLYSIGNSIDIFWVWGYIFFAFAVFPSNRFLDYIKTSSRKTELRKNQMVPLLSGAIFLVAFMSLVITSFFVNSDIEQRYMENLIFYGIFIVFLVSAAITFFALKVKKIKYQLSVGFTLIIIIFLVQTYYLNSIDEELVGVTEYHDMMSTPAISNLDIILVNSEIMHRSIHGYVLGHEHSLEDYDVARSKIIDTINDYNLLVFQTDRHGEYLADMPMQQKMIGSIEKLKNSLDLYDSAKTSFVLLDIPTDSQITSMFSSLDTEIDIIRDVLSNARQMEITGQINSQNKVNQYEQMSEFAYSLSIIFVSLTVTAVILVISNTMKKNIESLKEITSKVAKGDFTARVNLEHNTEFSELGEQINSMASELGEYQENALKAEKLRSIGELASRLGHDLRNPLSTIKTTTAVIKMKAVMAKDDKYSQNLILINEAVDRMTYQIESVLDFIRTKPLEASVNYVQSIVKDAIDIIKVPKNIRINIEPTDVKITCDSQQLSIVFINLITNAIQAIGENSGEITITIKENNDQIICSIIDSGPGIPNDKIEKVFEPLFTTKQTGTGLGLASCKSIMGQHNGTLTVHNNPTTFTMTLPKRPQKSPQFNEMIVQRLKK